MGPRAGAKMYTPEGEEILIDDSDMEQLELIAGRGCDRVVPEREIFAIAEKSPKYSFLKEEEGIEQREKDEVVGRGEIRKQVQRGLGIAFYPACFFAGFVYIRRMMSAYQYYTAAAA